MSNENSDDTIHAQIEGFEETPIAPKETPLAQVMPDKGPEKSKEQATDARELPQPDDRSSAEYAPGFPDGSRVKLISTRFGDDGANPVWGLSQGMTGGTIFAQPYPRPNPCRVQWDNGHVNSYKPDYLVILNPDEEKLAADNLLLPRKADEKAEQSPWPTEATFNREAWLSEASRRIAHNPKDLTGVLFSVGFGKGGTRGASDWSVIENKASNGWQVFVRPSVTDKVPALACVVGALQKLGVRLVSREKMAGMGRSWPEYPQPDVTHEHKQQATRLIKCWCKSCGYTVRTTQRWLSTGAPLCHCATPPLVMEVAS